ncbi:helix-turn-helix transcriptional regulator [Tetragenococcus muriaticus]|uniref:Transcriptional regulator n=1 Tax=Tetragenococcus muriaticus 3MR10-3 TaxID=1302648 RepID=A0A091C4H1_9ENTE|nr:helix-turn-helix transcriptional regulator [Tetragenococcus muriaticus]KFN91585.1 transcriptional regulator [Tetragenococcus muriaticus 3MR10-3]
MMLANRVKEFRVAADLQQKELASRVGVTRQTVSLIEKGQYNPSLKLCLSICHVLEHTLDEIFYV